MANTNSKSASAVQRYTRRENNHGNVQRNTRIAKATVSSGARVLASNR
jgi:hypothetical protein